MKSNLKMLAVNKVNTKNIAKHVNKLTQTNRYLRLRDSFLFEDGSTQIEGLSVKGVKLFLLQLI